MYMTFSAFERRVVDEVKYISAKRTARRIIKYLPQRDTKSKGQTLLTDETTKLTKFIRR